MGIRHETGKARNTGFFNPLGLPLPIASKACGPARPGASHDGLAKDQTSPDPVVACREARHSQHLRNPVMPMETDEVSG
jgi:hypothetical protein